jgi:hypothetical protein
VDRCDRGELDAAGIRGVLRDQLGLDCDDLSKTEAIALEVSVAPGIWRTWS